MLAYVLTLSDLHAGCLALAIQEMTIINEITAKVDHVRFTCNWFIVLRKWPHGCYALAEKMFRKYQQISENLGNCNGVYFHKRIISKTGECVLKKNSTTTVFLYCGINQFKTLNISSAFIDQERFLIFSFCIHWAGEFFFWWVQLCRIVTSLKSYTWHLLKSR